MPQRIQNLQEKVRSLVRLPEIPMVAAEAFDLLADSRSTAGSIAAVLSGDRLFSGRLLHIANSPFVGYPHRVTTIDQAILLLGFESLQDILTGISMLDSVASHAPKGLDHRSFWDHSLAVALAARKYSSDAGFRPAGEAFLAGLFHDMGIVIEERFFPDEFHSAVGFLQTGTKEYSDAEEEIFGASHGEIGSWVAEQWEYPRHIVEAIRYHDRPALALNCTELTAVVHFADVLCTRLHIGCYMFDSMTTFSPAVLHALHFENEPAVDRHCADIARAVREEITETGTIASAV